MVQFGDTAVNRKSINTSEEQKLYLAKDQICCLSKLVPVSTACNSFSYVSMAQVMHPLQTSAAVNHHGHACSFWKSVKGQH